MNRFMKRILPYCAVIGLVLVGCSIVPDEQLQGPVETASQVTHYSVSLGRNGVVAFEETFEASARPEFTTDQLAAGEWDMTVTSWAEDSEGNLYVLGNETSTIAVPEASLLARSGVIVIIVTDGEKTGIIIIIV